METINLKITTPAPVLVDFKVTIPPPKNINLKVYPGNAMPPGGATGQVLMKSSNASFAAVWATVPPAAWETLQGSPADNTELVALIDAASPTIGINRVAVGNSTDGKTSSYSYFTYDGMTFSVGTGTNALNYKMQMDQYGLRVGKGSDLIGANTIPFEVAGSLRFTAASMITNPAVSSYLDLSSGSTLGYLTNSLFVGNGAVYSYIKNVLTFTVEEGLIRSRYQHKFGLGASTPYGSAFSDSRTDHGFIVHRSGVDDEYSAFGVTNGTDWYFRVDKSGHLHSSFVGQNLFEGSITIGSGTPLLSYDLNIASSAPRMTLTGATGFSVQEMYFGEGGGSYGIITRYSQGYSSTFNGTQLSTNGIFVFDNFSGIGDVILRSNEFKGIISIPGNNSLGYSSKQDKYGFRVDRLINIHSVNSYPLHIVGDGTIQQAIANIGDILFYTNVNGFSDRQLLAVGGMSIGNAAGSPTINMPYLSISASVGRIDFQTPTSVCIGTGSLVVGDYTTTSTTRLQLRPGTTAVSQLNLDGSVAPAAPNDGDMWRIGDKLYLRDGAVTKSITFT